MKNIIYIAIFVIAGLVIYSFMNPKADFNADKKEAIKFHRGTWKEAVEIARKENRLIFLDIYATWCGPCKRLKNTTFSNSRVGKYFNATFINVSLDGETGEGELLANQYKISGYPTLFILDKEGNIVARGDGYYDADELLELGRSAVK
ncbi:MAG: thioredoxin family protein [Ferruginibacter sp.]